MAKTTFSVGPWTPSESFSLIQAYSDVECDPRARTPWKRVSMKMLEHGHFRSAKQCRERALSQLFSKHVPFTHEEDARLLDMVAEFGHIWSELTKVFDSRSPLQLRYRFCSLKHIRSRQLCRLSVTERAKRGDVFRAWQSGSSTPQSAQSFDSQPSPVRSVHPALSSSPSTSVRNKWAISRKLCGRRATLPQHGKRSYTMGGLFRALQPSRHTTGTPMESPRSVAVFSEGKLETLSSIMIDLL